MFVTKYRRGAFTDRMPTRCEEIVREVCADFETGLREFDGGHDHVHLLVHHPPKAALSKPVDSLKGVSARLLARNTPVMSASIRGAGVSGPAPTSPGRWAEHH
ncbi:hypothetical protein GCM10009560_74060 [Nonomuraea longicatena]|uniref:Transposase IS200-like domain-containing protein n=1 Tax=Nonomuraea longicatena TaxID=83682 RepID=A0ABP4BNZ4_9ACTN